MRQINGTSNNRVFLIVRMFILEEVTDEYSMYASYPIQKPLIINVGNLRNIVHIYCITENKTLKS